MEDLSLTWARNQKDANATDLPGSDEDKAVVAYPRLFGFNLICNTLDTAYAFRGLSGCRVVSDTDPKGRHIVTVAIPNSFKDGVPNLRKLLEANFSVTEVNKPWTE